MMPVRAGTDELYPAVLSPTDKAVVAYLGVIAALTVIAASKIPAWPLFVTGHAVVAGLLILISRRPGNPGSQTRLVRLVRGWYPLVMVPLVFKELEHLVPRVHSRDFDWELAAIDFRVFGVHPTIWLERITVPWLTELLQLSYVTYYFLPLAIGIPLWRSGRYREYHLLLFALVITFFLSYFGYLSVPAIGPRFILNDQQSFPLEGLFLYAPIRSTLDWAEGITRDCFPSGHTAIALLVVYYSRRFTPRLFWWILPVVSALVFSTVYLRYHYVIDVVAGALLAVFVVAVSKPLYRALGGEPILPE
jgi:membrane-associated phospholipid phosphatase